MSILRKRNGSKMVFAKKGVKRECIGATQHALGNTCDSVFFPTE